MLKNNINEMDCNQIELFETILKIFPQTTCNQRNQLTQ